MATITAAIETSKGIINLDLFADKTPLTVANFVNLARRGYYDNLTFHRVIDDFMIQGGCPNGDGRGGPGYQFADEFDPSLRHDRPGLLSMANSGPGSNGSQFFITHIATSWLDDNHSIFGAVQGEADQAVVDAIEGGDSVVKITVSGEVEELLAAKEAEVKAWNAVLDG